MSGGQLVVLDRLGRDVKRYPLPEGLATIGSDPACDIRVMLPTVSPHHATVVVHANQTVVRNVSTGETLVNGRPVSVAALRHRDTVELGGRALRWEYADAGRAPRPLAPEPALSTAAGSAGRPQRRGRRGSAAAAAAPRSPALRLALEMRHRASMPGGVGGKQVAIVQPQRRDTTEQNEQPSPRPSYAQSGRGAASEGKNKRRSGAAAGLQDPTKATLWIESRKSNPRKSAPASAPAPAPRRKPHSTRSLNLMKIEAPLKIDRRKQAALRLMAGPRAALSAAASARSLLGSAGGRKSALKDPAGRAGRKTDSIKFDLSNLAAAGSDDDDSDEDSSLQYETSGAQSPSPRRSARRGTLQKIPNASGRYSRRTTKSTTDGSYDATVASAFKTHTLSPRSPSQARMESYSIVDLVSVDSDATRSSSVYGSVPSTNGSFGTPQNSIRRKTRSMIDPTLLTSSTPYVKTARASDKRSKSNPSATRSSIKDVSKLYSKNSTKRSKSLSTPENTLKPISVNSTRVSRASRSRSRINDSDFLLISSVMDDEDSSPKTSKRLTRADKSSVSSPVLQTTRTNLRKSRLTINITPNGSVTDGGTDTPENRNSPEDIGTPVLSIQSLLNSSHSSLSFQRTFRTGRASVVAKRKTIGIIQTKQENGGLDNRSKSLNLGVRKSLGRITKGPSRAFNKSAERAAPENEVIVTPKSAVKLVQEAVKNKHSTAKKPQSKRSIIDDLNESDIVKQLFNSPVKRKLSQSMTEFSKKQSFEDDDDLARVKRPTRNTVALTGRTPDASLSNETGAYTPEVFVSPLGTPGHSPDLDGIERLFGKRTPENDLRDVRGVRALLRTPRVRRSVENDLTRVSGVKNVFAESPKNRPSDVRENDPRSVSEVEVPFRSQKRASPVNYVRDARGARELFADASRRGRGARAETSADLSGVEALFDASEAETSAPVAAHRGTANATAAAADPDASGRDARSSLAATYSARKLPIKKRSLPTPPSPRAGGREPPSPRGGGRAPPHSTPVGGRSHAPRVSRVSPIPPAPAASADAPALYLPPESPRPAEKSITSPKGRRGTKSVTVSMEKSKETIVSPKGRRGTKAEAILVEKPKETEVEKMSPKKSRASKAARVEKPSQVKNTKKRRASLVLTKKAPVLSPKPVPTTRTRRTEQKDAMVTVANPSPKKTRRQKRPEIEVGSQTETPIEKSKTPKRTTRAKLSKPTVVVNKPSPKMNPRTAKSKAVDVQEPEQKRKTRKTTALSENDKKGKQKVQSPEKPAPKTRGAHVTKSKSKQTPTKVTQKRPKGKTQSKPESPIETVEKPSTKSRSRKVEVVVEIAKTTRKKTQSPKGKNVPVAAAKTRGRRNEADTVPAKGRKNKASEKVEPVERKTRGKTQASVEPAPKRGGRTKTENKSDVAQTRKRKITAEVAVPSKLRKTRSDDVVGKGKGKKVEAKDTSGKQRAVRGGKESVVEKTRTTRARGEAAAQGQAKVAAESTRGGRKRKDVADTPDRSAKDTKRTTRSRKR